MSVAAVILAAGRASRAAGPKAVWPVLGRPAVRRVAESVFAAGVQEVLVVTGAWEREVKAALAGLPLTLLSNPRYETGQSESLKIGLAAIGAEAKAVLFLLADQPLISPEIIRGLIDSYQKSPTGIVAPVFAGRRRNPVLFDLERRRDSLSRLYGDRGARDLLAENPPDLRLWPSPGPEACFQDFDSLTEYQELSRYAETSSDCH